MNIMHEVGKLQDDYKKLLHTKKLTKTAICELVRPFRDKYKLTDIQALQITRNELSITQIADLLSNKTLPQTKIYCNIIECVNCSEDGICINDCISINHEGKCEDFN